MERQTNSGTVTVAYWVAAGLAVFMLIGHCVYPLIAYFVARAHPLGPGARPGPGYSAMRFGFFGAAVVMFLLMHFMWRALLQGRRTARLLAGRPGVFVGSFVGAALLTYGLCESVTGYGLTLFFAARREVDFLVFFALSSAFYAAFFPRLGRWRRRAAELGIGAPRAPSVVSAARRV